MVCRWPCKSSSGRSVIRTLLRWCPALITVSLIDSLDLTQVLAKDAYKAQLATEQARFARLMRDKQYASARTCCCV